MREPKCGNRAMWLNYLSQIHNLKSLSICHRPKVQTLLISCYIKTLKYQFKTAAYLLLRFSTKWRTGILCWPYFTSSVRPNTIGLCICYCIRFILNRRSCSNFSSSVISSSSFSICFIWECLPGASLSSSPAPPAIIDILDWLCLDLPSKFDFTAKFYFRLFPD